MPDTNSTPLAVAITNLIKAYVALHGCGDPECHTCRVGVAIGLEALDAAYNAGANNGTGQGPGHKPSDEKWTA